MRIGVYGGAFNPPHNGHLHAVESARAALGLDRVIVVPSCVPPHKEIPPGTPSDADRLEMARLAFSPIGAQISDMELRRGGVSYTAQTMELFASQHPGDDLWFIVGTDMFLSMHKWKTPERIFALCRIAAVPREADDRDAISEQKAQLERAYGARVDVVPVRPYEAASSHVRAALRSGGNDADALSEAVRAYIARRGLYKDGDARC